MEKEVLLVTVTPNPHVKVVTWPTKRVSVEGQVFEDTGAGDTNGFYDFLRRLDGRIVGVRFTPFIEHSDVCESAITGPGLRLEGTAPTAAVELFWAGVQEYSDSLSADQFMDYNYVFKSSSQVYAITFGFDHLEESEISDLLSGLLKKS